eukprot:scaffold22560_cov135-Cylindrotheca_fusiformis.AAC.72
MTPQAVSSPKRVSENTVDSILSPVVQDVVATGTKNILQSHHVSEGPGRIANSPVPSIFRDDRGSIDRLRVGGKRINILHSKAGVMRSGYLHAESKFDYLMCGKVELWVLTEQGTSKRIYNTHEVFEIPAYTPHILYFMEDTTMTEHWEQSGETRCWIYHPYRRIVDVQNSLHSKSTGQHHLLVPQIEFDRAQNQAPAVPALRSLLWLSTGIAIGAVVGSILAKPK